METEKSIAENRFRVFLSEIIILGDLRWQREVWGGHDPRYVGWFRDSLTSIELDIESGLFDLDIMPSGITKEKLTTLRKFARSAIDYFHACLQDPRRMDAIEENIEVLLRDERWEHIILEAQKTLRLFVSLSCYPKKRTADYDL